jgi:thiamine-monophosphate kinase
MVRRSTAKGGDAIYVSGTIGDSGAGLELLGKPTTAIPVGDRNFLIDAYRLPKPPVRFGWSLSYFANAAVDVSDGLIADLGHLASASGIQIEIDAEAIPRSEALRAFWGNEPDAILRAATAGDDYQIAFAADPAREPQIRADAASAGIVVTRVGTARPGEGVRILYRGAVLNVPQPGYRHF